MIDVHLPQFEGPLALLLYLIRKEEMDIFDIDIHQITSQYFEYIRRMKELDLETAGDFVAMAATLIQIKSQMLLPQYTENGEELEQEDPRKELVNRLLEYQRFQELSKRIYEKPLLGRDTWVRGRREEIVDDDEEDMIIIEEGGLYALISHYRRALRGIKKAVHTIAQKTKSIAGQIALLKDRLLVGQQVVMRDLISSAEDMRSEVLITFLSMLELGKMGFVTLFQSETYGDIYITANKPIDNNAIDRAQEYDAAAAEAVAESIFEDAMENSTQQKTFSLSDEDEEESMSSASMASDEDIESAEKELDTL
jgi:segregation and condensation protein A